MSSIRDTINQALQQQQPPAPGAPVFSAPPPQQFVPQGQPPQGAPPFQAFAQGAPPAQAPNPSGYAGAPFQPAPGQPGYAPQTAPGPQPHVGPPEYQQAFQPAPAPAPVQAQPQAAQAPAPQPVVWVRGMPNPQDPNWVYDGNGSWMSAAQFHAEQAQASAPPVQTSPFPAVAQASAPELATDTDDGTPEADLTALGALFLTLIQSAIGMLNTGERVVMAGDMQSDLPKKRGRKPKASA